MKIQNLFRGIVTATILSTCTVSLSAQGLNLVPNGGFEDSKDKVKISKVLKSHGQMEDVITSWFAATDVPGDVYSADAKGDKVKVPENKYGSQKASEGFNYGGFRAYSKDPKLSRSYLEVHLPQMLEKNVMYCVEFDISLADLSRYAVNDIGVVLNDRKIEYPNDRDIVRPADVNQKSNKVFKVADAWDSFCGTFIGTGQEEYLLIGCFGGRNDLTIEKVKPAKGITGTTVNHAYYYIDNVKITSIDAKSQCNCTLADERDMDLVYGSSPKNEDGMSDAEKIENSIIYYAFLKRYPTGAGRTTVEKLATILKDDPALSISIFGHCDSDEKSEGIINNRYAKIGLYRAEEIKASLEEAGIASSRIVVSDRSDIDTASSLDSEISRAKNRRVTFKVTSK